MFLLIVIVILIASASILWNIYMWIFSLQQNYGDINNYYNSYYAAISSIERWLLVTKYKQPSFVWSGWFIGNDNRWEASEMFSGNFGKFTEWNNWLVWEINSYCENITWALKHNNVLTIKYLSYTNDTEHYEVAIPWSAMWLSVFLELTWDIINNYNIDLADMNIYRQVDERGTSWFVISSWDTMINNSWYIYIYQGTTDPSNIAPIWNTLCTEDWCFSGLTVGWWVLTDEQIHFYIKDRIIWVNSWQLWHINYNFNLYNPGSPWVDMHTNCPNYTIIWNWTIWKYKNTLQIQKPAFNYKNPYRQDFIFPYYN